MADEPVEQHDVDEDDEREPSERDSVGRMGSWSNDFLRPAREFRRRFPDAALECQFPVVFEEDRSKMIADLSAARAEGAITHRQMAERVAKELGIEAYDYTSEQHAIAREQPALPRMPTSEPGPVGAGDALAFDAEDELELHRQDLSGDATRRFRRQQKQAEAASAPTLLFKQVERDESGTPARVVEAYSDGRVRASRVIYDDRHRIVGLEVEPELEPEPDAQGEDT